FQHPFEKVSYKPSLCSTTPYSLEKLARYLREEVIKIAVHTSTAITTKSWADRQCDEFVREILSEEKRAFVFGVGTRPFEGAMIHHQRFVPCYGLSLPASIFVISNADIFVGIDSGPLHIADIYRVPCVGIFGPSAPSRWGCRF